MRTVDLTNIARQAIANSPQWVRADLTSKDALLKARAEDALAAMIAAALAGPGSDPEDRAAFFGERS